MAKYMTKYDYKDVICWLEPHQAIKFISHFPPELNALVDLDVVDDGALVLKWRK